MNSHRITARHLHWGAHVAAVVAFVAVFIAGVGSGAVVTRYVDRHGGAIAPSKQALPPVTNIGSGAGQIPWHFSLAHWTVRVHDQGDDQACGCHVAAEDVEILNAESTGRKIAYSSGYVCAIAHMLMGQTGLDAPLSLAAMAGSLIDYGDAPLSAFWPDGTPGTFGYYPDAGVQSLGRQRAFRAQIRISDQRSVAYYISRGYPVAVLRPAHSTVYQDAVPVITGDGGGLLFYHFELVVGYRHHGNLLSVLNSWGQGYGHDGIQAETWNSLASDSDYAGGTVFFVNLPGPWFHVRHPKPFPLKAWTSYTRTHGLRPIPHARFGHLTFGARFFVRHLHVLRAPIARAHFHRRPHGRGYESQTFVDRHGWRRTLFWWPKHPHWHARLSGGSH